MHRNIDPNNISVSRLKSEEVVFKINNLSGTQVTESIIPWKAKHNFLVKTGYLRSNILDEPSSVEYVSKVKIYLQFIFLTFILGSGNRNEMCRNAVSVCSRSHEMDG